MSIEVSTNDDLQYNFFPVTSGCVNFRVKASNDAHVALTTGPFESDPMVEVFIGGWSNKKSVIRRNRSKPDKVEVDTDGILNGDEFRSFWVRWSNGNISAGIEGAGAFIEWTDPEPFQVSHVGVCTGWGASGSWIIEGRTECQTDDSLQYQFHPVISGELDFEFRGPSNCHVALTKGETETDPMYEVLIGGWENKKSVIRHRRQKPDKVVADTDGIVHAGEFRRFIVQWVSGRIIVRSGIDGSTIMEWTDDDPFPITHVGVRTAWGATGQWRINTNATLCKREQSTTASAPPMGGNFNPSCWVPAGNGEIPPGAIVGGQDGENIFVGRARHEGALIPGKVLQSHGVCYVAWGGGEHGVPDYEVLCACANRWVPTSGAAVPANALPGGETEDGEPLFIGRVQHEGSLSVGKVQASHGVCYISYGGEELGFADYECLVVD